MANSQDPDPPKKVRLEVQDHDSLIADTFIESPDKVVEFLNQQPPEPLVVVSPYVRWAAAFCDISSADDNDDRHGYYKRQR